MYGARAQEGRRKSKLKVRNDWIKSDKKAGGNRKEGPGNRQQAIGNRQQATNSIAFLLITSLHFNLLAFWHFTILQRCKIGKRLFKILKLNTYLTTKAK